MTPKLNEEQQQVLHGNGDRHMRVVDPSTSMVYVLVAVDEFERIKPLIDDDFDISETYAAQFAALDTPECWGAPGMELYDEYDVHKPQR